MANPTNRIQITLNQNTQDYSTGDLRAPDPALYIAGCLVSFSGMYVATYQMADVKQAFMLNALIICGYMVSYWLRKLGVDVRKFQLPMFMVFLVVMYMALVSAPSGSGPAEPGGTVRSFQIQLVIVWIAILQCFTLLSNAAVLFACVPALALLGIMATGSADDEIRWAFYLFISSATFVMVRENQLRSGYVSGKTDSETSGNSSRPITGDLIAVAACVLGSIMLGTAVAGPIEVVGKAILPVARTDFDRNKNQQNASAPSIRVDEEKSLEIGTGPRSGTETQLIQFNASAPIGFWRGMTYDYWAGVKFEDHWPAAFTVYPGTAGDHGSDAIGSGFRQESYSFDPTTFDIGDGKLEGASSVETNVHVLGGSMSHLYGPATFSKVTTTSFTLNQSRAGSLATETPIVQGTDYRIVSQVPSSDPARLRNAPAEYSTAIKSHYLQIDAPGFPRNQRLQSYADEVTRGKLTNYDKVEAIRDAISKDCRYNLQAPAVPRDRDAVASFLFETKQGYCDSYAAALTVLCRYAGIPARVASGFVAGDEVSPRSYVVKEKHKHVWCEVYFTNIGWVPFDATEGTNGVDTESDNTVTKHETPLRWLTAHGPVPPVLALLIIGLAVFVLKSELGSRLRKKHRNLGKYDPLPELNALINDEYNRACSKLARRGFRRNPAFTPTMYASSIDACSGDLAEQTRGVAAVLTTLTNLHAAFCYGLQNATRADIDRARQANIQLENALRKMSDADKRQLASSCAKTGAVILDKPNGD